jgi:hypothetical protein
MRVSFEIPPEEFSSSSKLCCDFKRKAKAGELKNATAILTHLITQANKETNNLDSILADIHRALELCGTGKEANESLYESLVVVTLSLVASGESDMPPFEYLQVLPRYHFLLLIALPHIHFVYRRLNEPFKAFIHESISLLFDTLTAETSDVQLLRTIHAYSLLVSFGLISCGGMCIEKYREERQGGKGGKVSGNLFILF